MSVTIIEQRPLYGSMPIAVGQELIFAVKNNSIVANETKVQFQARVYISDDIVPNTASNTHLIGTFKTTPNNAGVGIFDLSPVVETYVKADQESTNYSEFRTVSHDAFSNGIPMHLIDKYSGNKDLARFMVIEFSVNYWDSTNLILLTRQFPTNSNAFRIFNGYVTEDTSYDILNGNYGIKMDDYTLGSASSNPLFYSNAPTTQYAYKDDYGTVCFYPSSTSSITTILFTYLDSSGSTLATDTISANISSGALMNNEITWDFLFLGVFPANLRGWSTNFVTHLANIDSYTVVARNASAVATSAVYTFKINCPDEKQFEPIRLCWLNQYGGWDYYTFNKKSVRTISKKGTSYTQLGGTWNESHYQPKAYKGGKKTFRVNATEKIRINSDFITESESLWMEFLMNSPEVYILKGYDTVAPSSSVNNNSFSACVSPVRITTNNITRKTIANDKLLQYTFEIERSKTLRTQSI